MRINVPLGSLYSVEEVDAFGLLVAWYPLPISYYFVDLSRIRDHDEIKPENAVLVMQHHRLGFKKGLWTILETLTSFDATHWPVPIRIASDQDGSHVPASKIYVENSGFSYDVDWEDLGVTMDYQLFGFPGPARQLRKIIDTGKVEAGRINYYPHPKPDGGEWFKRYKQKRAEITRTDNEA